MIFFARNSTGKIKSIKARRIEQTKLEMDRLFIDKEGIVEFY